MKIGDTYELFWRSGTRAPCLVTVSECGPAEEGKHKQWALLEVRSAERMFYKVTDAWLRRTFDPRLFKFPEGGDFWISSGEPREIIELRQPVKPA